MTFTEKLDMLMVEKHLNKNTLSKSCGIPYTTIDGWYKKGVSDLKLSTLKKLTAYFDLSLDYWLDDDIVETKKVPESYVSETACATPEERELLSLYNRMNDDGKKLLLSTARTYAGNPAMQKESSCEEAI